MPSTRISSVRKSWNRFKESVQSSIDLAFRPIWMKEHRENVIQSIRTTYYKIEDMQEAFLNNDDIKNLQIQASLLDLVANINSPGATSFFRPLSNQDMAAHPIADDEETQTTLATKNEVLDEMTQESIGSAGHYFCYRLSWEFTSAVRTGFPDGNNTLKSLTGWRKIQ